MNDFKKESKLKKLRLPVITSGIVITALVTTLYIVDIAFLRLIDNRLYDTFLKIAFKRNLDKIGVTKNSNSQINFKNNKNDYTSVIVDIDEYSLSHFGQWPWPRYHVAKLLNKIHDAGAVSVGIDIIFSEPDRTSIVEIQKALKNEFNINVTLTNINNLSSNSFDNDINLNSSASNSNIDMFKIMDNDILLSQSINKTSATLGYYFNFQRGSYNSGEQHSKQELEQYDVKDEPEQHFKHYPKNSDYKTNSHLTPLSCNIEFEPGGEPSEIFNYLFKAVGIISPISVLSNKETNSGFMNTLADSDGVLRRTPLFISWNNKIYPQLALSTLLNSNLLYPNLLKAKNNSMLNSNSESQQIEFINPVIKTSSNGVESIKLNKTLIYLDINGSMLLNYRGKAYTFPYISAGKILENDFRKEDLKGKIVFLGSSAAGLKDIRLSPLDQNFPGVEVHATIVDNIIKGDYLIRPDWAASFEAILTVLCGIIITFLISLTEGALLTLILVTMVGSLIFIVSLFGVSDHHIWISPLFPLLTLFINFSLLNLVKYGLSEKDKRFYRSAFSHYVSQSVVNQIIESPEKFSLEGEEKDISILFSDIRNFSSISEKLSPSQVSSLLHNYFTPVTRIVIDHKGTLDKFIGDAIMCFWNAPITIENHKELALNVAIKILKTLEKLSISFEKNYGVKIKTGIGLHSGVCRVGNMGSADLFDYTAIGDHVNIASRLEGLTKFYGVDLIFSESMVPKSDEEVLVQYVDRVRVKGKTEPLNIYTAHIISKWSNYAAMKFDLDKYNSAIEKYQNRYFKEGFEIFSELDESQMGRIRLYSIYKKRAWEFMNDPPDKRWDGVFNHTSK